MFLVRVQSNGFLMKPSHISWFSALHSSVSLPSSHLSLPTFSCFYTILVCVRTLLNLTWHLVKTYFIISFFLLLPSLHLSSSFTVFLLPSHLECVCVSQNTCVEVRGQLVGMESLLPLCNPKDQTQVFRIFGKCLFLSFQIFSLII